MYKNIEILNLAQHKTKALKELANFSNVAGIISVPVSFNEFYEACRDYPIFFAKDSEGKWFASALLGYKDKNVFIGTDGSWKAGSYIPAFIRRYPFTLVKDNDNVSLAFDKECSEELNETNKARAFFNEDDTPTELSKEAMNFLLELNATAQATTELIKELEQWELLEEKTASIIDAQGNTHNIGGFFTVNEEKLAHLGEKKRLDIFKKGALPLITAHLISLGNIRRMGL